MDVATSSSGNTERFTSYKDYVNFLAGKNSSYKFLAHVFNTDSPDPVFWDKYTKLVILDSEDGQLTERPVSDSSLADCPTGVKTRIVLLSYGNVWSIDRKKLDKFAFDLDLPAFSLWEHLDHPGLHEELFHRGIREDLGPRPPFAASSGLRFYPHQARNLALMLRFLALEMLELSFVEVTLSAWLVPSCASGSSSPAANIGTLVLDCMR